MNGFHRLSVLANRVADAVEAWLHGAVSGTGAREVEVRAVADSWELMARELLRETGTSLWLSLPTPGPSWRVPAVRLEEPDYLCAKAHVVIVGSDKQVILDTLGVEDLASAGIQSVVAAAYCEFGWDAASCTSVDLRFDRVDVEAWWSDAPERAQWSCNASELGSEAPGLDANFEPLLDQLRFTLLEYLSAELTRKALDGLDGYWEAADETFRLASEVAGCIDALDTFAWSQGVASPVRAAINAPMVAAARSWAEPVGRGGELHICATAVVAYASPALGARSNERSRTSLHAATTWLRDNAWLAPSGPGLPASTVSVEVSSCGPDGSPGSTD